MAVSFDKYNFKLGMLSVSKVDKISISVPVFTKERAPVLRIWRCHIDGNNGYQSSFVPQKNSIFSTKSNAFIKVEFSFSATEIREYSDGAKLEIEVEDVTDGTRIIVTYEFLVSKGWTLIEILEVVPQIVEHPEEKKEKSPLNEIIDTYPFIWKDSRRLKALLMDFYPADKLLRNLLFISVDEQIPELIYGKNEIGNITFSICKNKIINACGCGENLASNVIRLWAEAFGIELFDGRAVISGDKLVANRPFSQILIGDLELSVRAYNCLKKKGINTLADLESLTLEEMKKIPNLSRNALKEIMAVMMRYGIEIEEGDGDDPIAPFTSNEKDEIQSGEQKEKIAEQLQLSLEKEQEGDYLSFLEHFEKAVDLGYRGNYSIIGQLYLTGLNGIPVNLSKGFRWLQRFYDDFKSGNLELDNNSAMLEVCHQLGVLYLVDLQNGNYSTALKQYKIDNVLNIWKEEIRFASEKRVGETDAAAAKLFAVGCSFYYGEIQLGENETIGISVDYENAFRAFIEAERLGSIPAITLLAEMNEKGRFVKKDSIAASNRYLAAALKGDANAAAWCQKYFIEELPWDKQSDWSNAVIAEELQGDIADVAEQIKCVNFEDIKNFEFNSLKKFEDSHISERDLRRLFVYVAKFVKNYRPSPDAELKSVIGIADIVYSLAKYGYDVQPGAEIEDIYKWLNSFYEGIQNETIQVAREYEDIARVEYKLGICFAYGIGTEANTEKAAELFARVIIHGKENHHDIVLACSVSFYHGAITAFSGKDAIIIKVDYKQAYRGFKKLATKGNPEAKYYLAKMFEDGQYVEQDLRQAIKLYKSAADDGQALAKKWLRERNY